jgi:hypothetical protein
LNSSPEDGSRSACSPRTTQWGAGCVDGSELDPSELQAVG